MANIDTAAMEQILANLYKQAEAQGKAQRVAFTALAKASGLDPKIIKTTEDRLKELGDDAEAASVSTSKLGKAGNVVGAVMADLVGGLTATVGNVAKFAASTLSGKAHMSDFIGAFKDLPIIGSVASLFAGLQKIQEENLQVYRDLTTSGINFGEGLSSINHSFLSLGLNAESYTRILKDNADIFVLMGSSVTAGARNFRMFNKSLLDNHSELLNLGFSYEEVSKTVTNFARSTAGLNKQQQQDIKGTTDSMAAYAKEVDLLARLTGNSREAIQEKAKKEQEEASWQAFLSTLGPEAKKRIDTFIKEVQNTQGEAGVQIAKAAIQGVEVQQEQGQLMTALASKSAELTRQGALEALNSTKSSSQYSMEAAIRLGKLQFQGAQDMKSFGAGLMNILQQGGSNIPAVFAEMNRQGAMLNNNGLVTLEQVIARNEMERKKQADDAAAADAEVARQLAAEKAVRDFALKISDVLIPLLNKYMFPALEWASSRLDWLGDRLAVWRPKIGEFVDNLFTDAGRTKIINDTVKLLKELFTGIMRETGIADKVKEVTNEGKIAMGTVAGYALATIGTAAAAVMTGGMSLPVQAALMGGGALAGGAAGYLWGDHDDAPGRAFGSKLNTGNYFENFGNGTPLMGHGKEGMFTESNIDSLITGATQSGVGMALEVLNNGNNQMISLLKEIADHSRNNVDATKAMSNNAFA